MTVPTFPPIAAPTRRVSAGLTRRVRTGFSFVELMFAVVILGIGFILLAAVFPVGLSQAKSTFDESVAASVGRGAAAYVEKIANNATMPGADTFVPLQGISTSAGTVAAQQNMIQAADPRFAWVCLYRRPTYQVEPLPAARTAGKVAQVIFFVTQSGSQYDGNDFLTGTQGRQLEPREVKVDIVRGGDNLYRVTVSAADSPASNNTGAVAPGAFLVIAADNVPAPDSNRMNGHIYRFGAPTNENPNEYFLAPGYEFSPDPDPDGDPANTTQNAINRLDNARAYIIGRSRTGPNNATFENVAQDVAIYTTFIDVK